MSQKKDNIPLFKKSQFEVARLIFNHPNKIFHIRELEKLTKLSTTAVISALDSLGKYEIVKVEKTNITTNIKANLESDNYSFYKRIYNLYMLKKFINKLRNIYTPKTIVLFGSFARGEDIEQSDIDLLVITNKTSEDIKDLPSLCEKELNRKLNMHILTSLDKSSAEFKNAVANGIVLQGYLKLI